MNKYIKLLKLIWNGICIGYCLWKEEEIFERLYCEYCDAPCSSKNICTHCNRKQPKSKLGLTFETKRMYYIEAWDEKLARSRSGSL